MSVTVNKRYFWLKLPEDFFSRDDIKIIESQKNGPQYIILYLKLLTKSIEAGGNLRFNELIPYNEEMISTITSTDIDIVRTAMKLFENLGLLELLEDQTIFMLETEKMIGSETASTRRSQKSRAKKELQLLENEQKIVALQHTSNNLQQNATESKSIELDIEKDIEKEKEYSTNLDNLDTSSETLKKDNKENNPHIQIPFSFISETFQRLKLKSNPKDFYNFYQNQRNWKFNNGNLITEKSIPKLAINWEVQEIKYNIINSQENKDDLLEDLGTTF